MNERIQKLANKAGFIRFSKKENPDMPIDWSSDYTNELEKFAELILLECNMALQPYLRDMISRGQACDLIDKHFGVE